MNNNLKKDTSKRIFSYDNIITIIFMTLLAITIIFNAVFQNGNKIFRIISIIATVIVLKVIFTITFFKRSKATYIAALIFIFMAMYLGNVWDFYSSVPSYDKILHFFSGIIIGIIGLIVYAHFTKEYMQKLNIRFMLVFVFIFCAAMAGLWEIWEFSGDRVFGLNSQNNSLVDTMMDIICGTVGGIISLIPIYRFGKGNKNKFLEKVTKEVM